ncbi:hypothetical protein [Moorena producens]|uniref:hypothetical protein n=1 Tax=Moorena producens TaxID=1155739 RepID=UPI0011EA6AFF|nr:hypothetical protein [Moorena producens]
MIYSRIYQNRYYLYLPKNKDILSDLARKTPFLVLDSASALALAMLFLENLLFITLESVSVTAEARLPKANASASDNATSALASVLVFARAIRPPIIQFA